MFRSALVHVCLYAALGLGASATVAQTPPPAAAAAGRVLGTVKAISGGVITVQPQDATLAPVPVTVNEQTRLLRIAPGEKDLKNAQPLSMTDLAVGDRVLIRVAAPGDAEHPVAASLIAMKRADISHAHEEQSLDWQRRGVSGIVASVDPSTREIVLRPVAGQAEPRIVLTPSTVVRRYAPDSTAFEDTQASTFTEIHPGDQVRARGAKSADGTMVTAEEVVSGSFQDITGVVVTADATAGTLTIRDSATKQPLTLVIAKSTQVRRLPAGSEGAGQRDQEHHGATGAPGTGSSAGTAGSPAGERAGGRAGGRNGFASVLQRAPVISIADLKKGDTVLVVAGKPENGQITAISVVAGVESLLRSTAGSSEGLFAASWNLGGETPGADSAP
jgi:hypothetical protein